MEQPFLNGNTKAGTFGGILLVLLFRINKEDLLASALLAAVGATVSFGVSVFLKFVLKRLKRK
ncbi:MAG: hypothetical protein ABIN36_03600 [Ferruginibacter sp.]